MSPIVAFSNPLHPLETILRHILDWLHLTVGLPWAWAIVALTVMVRILLVPLVIKQIHSMQSLQRHAPEWIRGSSGRSSRGARACGSANARDGPCIGA